MAEVNTTTAKSATAVRRIAYLAGFSAFTVVTSIMIVIPIPGAFGYITPVDVGILTGSIIMANQFFSSNERGINKASHLLSGFAIGGISGALLDLLTGYLQWAPFSLLIHGGEGLICALIAYNALGSGQKIGLRIWSAMIAAEAFVLIGYFFVTWWIYGIGAGLFSLPTNLAQVALGIVGSLLLLTFTHRYRNFRN
jgi:uncharacterized membrane protein